MKENTTEPLLLEYDNLYWKDNPEYFGQLYILVKQHPKAYGKIIISSKYIDIYKWINTVVPILNNPIYKISTKIVWIITGQTNFKKCLNPNCQNLVGVGLNYGFTRRSLYCCQNCQKTSPIVNERKSQKMLSHLDEDPEYFNKLEQLKKQTKRNKGLPENWCNGKKIKESFEKRLAEDPDFWKKRENKSKLTKIQRGHDPNWHNIEKGIETRRKKYNGQFEDQSIALKRKATSKNKYGCDFPLQAEEVKLKRKQTFIKKYGVDSPMQLDSFKQRLGDILQAKYGVRHIMQLSSIQRKSRQKYFYNGQHYSSGDEIYFMIYHNDMNDNIVYQPDISFKYELDGKTYFYHPDFILNGCIIELKGNQFFRSDGTMFCPFRKKSWTDEEYNKVCERYEAKRQCMLRNNVQIIQSKSQIMNDIRKYVNIKYGKDYVKSFKVKHDDNLIESKQ